MRVRTVGLASTNSPRYQVPTRTEWGILGRKRQVRRIPTVLPLVLSMSFAALCSTVFAYHEYHTFLSDETPEQRLRLSYPLSGLL